MGMFMKGAAMAASGAGKKTKLFVVLIGIAIGVLVIALVRIAPSILTRVRSATELNPGNFDEANVEFFSRLADNTVEILTFSSTKPFEVDQSGIKVMIVPIERDIKRKADQANKRAHANGIVLVFACHEVLHGNRELGTQLLKLLKQYDGTIRYNYPTGKNGPFGDTGTNISIDELLRAADSLGEGDPSGKGFLERPASQYNWLKDQYAPANGEQ